MITLIKIVAVIVLVCLSGAQSLQGAVGLRSYVTVTGPMIRLQDVFTNLGALQDEQVEAAPSPGATVQYRAAWADALAKRYAIDWSPPSADLTITFARSGHALSSGQITTAVRQAIDQQSATTVPSAAEIVLDREPRIMVPEGSDTWALRVEDLRLQDQRFQAHLVIAEKDGGRENRTSISGQWIETIAVPALATTVRPGDILTESMFVLQSQRKDRVRPDTVLDVQQIIGKTPAHRALAAGENVRHDELKFPTIIQRNAIVTMIVQTPFMMVSARGRALNDAARGEETKVANLDSQKVVSGIAISPGVVTLAPAGSIDAAYN